MNKGRSSLQDVLVVDISRLLPGGVASLLLAEQGARVIKIEQPGVGDYYRAALGGSNFLGSGQFQIVNQKKESLGLDLKQPEGKALFLKLVRKADVVIENFRPGTLKRLGLDFAALKKINRRLVLCSITGAWQKGPLAGLAGHDLNTLALSGLLSMIRDHEERPVVPEFQIVDLAVGYEAAFRIASALFQRQKSGRGEWLDLSMWGAGLSLGRYYAARGTRFGSEILSGSRLARYGVYQTKEGRYVALAALEPKFWRAFCDFIGRPDLAREAESYQFIGEKGLREIEEVFKGRTREEWTEIGRRHDFCLSPVVDVTEVSFPRSGKAPEMGEQSGHILRSLGCSPARIRDLKERGIVA